MRKLRSVGLAFCAMILLPGIGAAQDSGRELELTVPGPELCSGEPLQMDQIMAVAGTPLSEASPEVAAASPNPDAATPTPFIAPTGTPASDETTAEVTRLVMQLYACQNANDQARAFALFSDGYLTRLLQSSTPRPEGFLNPGAASGTPVPDPVEVAVHFVVELRPDVYGVDVIGRYPATDTEFTDYLIVVRSGGELRVDDIIDLT